MKKSLLILTALGLLFNINLQAQEEGQVERKPGHYNQSKFKQLYEEFSSPNTYRSARCSWARLLSAAGRLRYEDYP